MVNLCSGEADAANFSNLWGSAAGWAHSVELTGDAVKGTDLSSDSLTLH